MGGRFSSNRRGREINTVAYLGRYGKSQIGNRNRGFKGPQNLRLAGPCGRPASGLSANRAEPMRSR